MTKKRLQEIIFEADTPAGKAFDILLIISVLMSVVIVMLESVVSIEVRFGFFLRGIEWLFTTLFTIEYVLRLYSVQKSIRYAVSFFGIVDLLAILPSYISLLLPGSHYFMAIRILRVLRVFRVFKLAAFVKEINQMIIALKASARRILIFLLFVLTLVVVMGAAMYIIEDASAGFTSIPRSVYWAIVTLTTVGYGDISPQTGIGQALAAIIMILGYSIIVVPTGFVSIALSSGATKQDAHKVCSHCNKKEQDDDAVFCKFCGEKLEESKK